ncbi:uncharacterized protein VTP21DRAFT_1313 [Calcarisporiella thermophila]|uniref:uncharacterized protein n=1 Tax=Calcarisporiella thermophila TaxID=911321 RepID=UPI003744A7A7
MDGSNPPFNATSSRASLDIPTSESHSPHLVFQSTLTSPSTSSSSSSLSPALLKRDLCYIADKNQNLSYPKLPQAYPRYPTNIDFSLSNNIINVVLPDCAPTSSSNQYTKATTPPGEMRSPARLSSRLTTDSKIEGKELENVLTGDEEDMFPAGYLMIQQSCEKISSMLPNAVNDAAKLDDMILSAMTVVEVFRKTLGKNRKGKIKGQLRCQNCKSTETPEWRKGPMGPRTLCNACGLTWAKTTRQNHKNQSHQQSKRGRFMDKGYDHVQPLAGNFSASTSFPHQASYGEGINQLPATTHTQLTATTSTTNSVESEYRPLAPSFSASHPATYINPNKKSAVYFGEPKNSVAGTQPVPVDGIPSPASDLSLPEMAPIKQAKSNRLTISSLLD